MSSDVQDASAPEETVDPLDPRRFHIVDKADEGRWIPDFLGSGFEQMTLPLPADSEGESVVTLVRHVPDADPLMDGEAPEPRFTFICLHGWNDYFYQAHLARAISAAGGAFYAMDLRRFGRSLRPGEVFGFVDDLAQYDAELDACIHAIADDGYGSLPLFLAGHSTGGLTATLWADRHPGTLAGVVLNSPWLEFQSRTTRAVAQRPISALAKIRPTRIISHTDKGNYQRVLTAWREGEALYGTRTAAEHAAGVAHLPAPGEEPAPGSPEFTGERAANPYAPEGTDDPFWTTGWQPDPRFRSFPSWDAPAAWLSAILRGHETIARGLNIDCPILMMTSAASTKAEDWCEEFTRTDCVLNLHYVWKRAGLLGAKVTLVKLENAIHDILFSRREVREKALAEIEGFVNRTLAEQA